MSSLAKEAGIWKKSSSALVVSAHVAGSKAAVAVLELGDEGRSFAALEDLLAISWKMMGLSHEPPKAVRVDCCRRVSLASAAKHFHGEEGVQREDGILVAPQQLQDNLDHARK